MKKQFDEMERSIKLRASSIAHRVTVILLGIWTLYESYLVLFTEAQQYNIVPVLLLTASIFVDGFAELILKRKMIAGDEEYREPSKILGIVIVVIAIAAIITSVVTFILINRN